MMTIACGQYGKTAWRHKKGGGEGDNAGVIQRPCSNTNEGGGYEVNFRATQSPGERLGWSCLEYRCSVSLLNKTHTHAPWRYGPLMMMFASVCVLLITKLLGVYY